jgi:uncharacterized protein with PQ loop repeat
MDFHSILGLIGTVIDLTRATPQLMRLFRARTSFGVSVDTAGTSCAVSLGWTTYGIITNQIFVMLASGIMAMFFLIITLVALRFGRSVREFRIAPLWLTVLAVSVLFFGKTGLGLMLSISALISNVPQIRVAYREENLSGLSPGRRLGVGVVCDPADGPDDHHFCILSIGHQWHHHSDQIVQTNDKCRS